MIHHAVTSAEIDQHMRGQAWHIETFGNERNECDPQRRHITTAWTVYISRLRDHTYEVAQWFGGTVSKTHTIQILPDGRLTCSCPAGRAGFVRSVRGYCLHINRLMVHALRRLPTLPAPAEEMAALPVARGASAQPLYEHAAPSCHPRLCRPLCPSPGEPWRCWGCPATAACRDQERGRAVSHGRQNRG